MDVRRKYKQMSPEEAAKRAISLFDKGLHCSQAVFQACSEVYGMHEPQVIRALAPFGGGMGSSGGICGALPGALAFMGLIMGKAGQGQRDHRSLWKSSSNMVRAFKEITAIYGGPNCSDVARVDWTDPKQIRRFRKSPDSRRRECRRVIEETTRQLVEIVNGIKGL